MGDSQGGLPGQGGIGVEIWRRKKMEPVIKFKEHSLVYASLESRGAFRQ